MTKQEVDEFLNRFKQKAKIFGIIYRDDREKNEYTLLIIDIPQKERDKILMELQSEDFSEIIKDTLYDLGDLWVFGKNVKGHEIYIKISIGKINNSTICVSFHIAKHTIKYKFK